MADEEQIIVEQPVENETSGTSWALGALGFFLLLVLYLVFRWLLKATPPERPVTLFGSSDFSYQPPGVALMNA
tara:strand:- start:48707 stop:48925 length:219 start_codon:yes stop_codon:yes gene_type:complete